MGVFSCRNNDKDKKRKKNFDQIERYFIDLQCLKRRKTKVKRLIILLLVIIMQSFNI